MLLYVFLHVCVTQNHGFLFPWCPYVSLVSLLQIAMNYIDVLVTLAAFAELVFFWAFRTEMGVNPMRSSCKFHMSPWVHEHFIYIYTYNFAVDWWRWRVTLPISLRTIIARRWETYQPTGIMRWGRGIFVLFIYVFDVETMVIWILAVQNKMETTNPKVYTFYGDGSTIIRWLCTSLLFSAIGSDGRSSRAVSPKYPALPKILTLDIQDRQTFLHTNSFTHRHFYTQMLLHTEVLKQRSFYTQAPLHTDVFTHRPL